ncbi:MAG: hypothetical protein LBU90_06775 [Bacteroidales bacterium]|jgi:hypothetical protein|nr:hypothetical protein [Bacteroidales bacterium]
MTKKQEIEQFVIDGYKNISPQFVTDGVHNFVLKNRADNFILNTPDKFAYHRWAASLKSSQAFAYNVFSGVKDKNLEFELKLNVFDTPAQIDVKIESEETNTIDLFEVKMFEISSSEKIEFESKYDNKDKYEYISPEITEAFICFKNEVICHFEGKKIYGGGIKQLCSHLLGMLNNMNAPEFKGKKLNLYSFCFDNPSLTWFKDDVDNYKTALKEFNILADTFLKSINANSCIEYHGFLSAYEYIKKHEQLLGKHNFDYVQKRYFFNAQ